MNETPYETERMPLRTNRDLYLLPLCAAMNLIVVMILYAVCRGVYLWVNVDLFPELTQREMLGFFSSGLMFDISAVLYSNLLYIALALLPVPGKESRLYSGILKWSYLVPNAVCIFSNIADSIYFPFSFRRTTASVFREFTAEENLGEIFRAELSNHWYLAVTVLILFTFLWLFYIHPHSRLWHRGRIPEKGGSAVSAGKYYLTHFLILAAAAYPIVGGLRGGFGRQTRPITISNANGYVKSPKEAALVLNTPFSVMQTLGVEPFPRLEYYSEGEREAMEGVFNPVHTPDVRKEFKPLNVVIFIMESFGREYSGYLNRDVPDYPGYTPFLDSLMSESLTYKYSFANGHKSIDAMPSVLSSIPMFIEPFFLTQYSLNDVSGIAGELAEKGYYTAFFHGAKNGSMGFEAYARASGFADYFGRTEYRQWRGGDDSGDYDGYWGIWDEPFFQFFSDKMNSFKEPFCAGIFSISSHHPFVVPEKYEGDFPKGTVPMHQCIGYSDFALRRFFETASASEWFDRTLFIITGDHTNQSDLDVYKTDAGTFAVPVIFHYPAGNLTGVGTLRGFDEQSVAQQADIMPTVLGFLGYDSPYVAFGCDLLETPPEETFAVNYNNGFYQLFKGDFCLQYDGKRSSGLYRFRTDMYMKENLLDELPSVREEMEGMLTSIIQQYMERMNDNQLVIK